MNHSIGAICIKWKYLLLLKLWWIGAQRKRREITNIYFFTLQRFGPSPSLNFKSKGNKNESVGGFLSPGGVRIMNWSRFIEGEDHIYSTSFVRLCDLVARMISILSKSLIKSKSVYTLANQNIFSFYHYLKQ